MRPVWRCSSCLLQGLPLTALCYAIGSLAVYGDEVEIALLIVSGHLIYLAAVAVHPEAVARSVEGV